MTTINDDSTNSSKILELQGLEQEFENTMVLYKQAYLDYISALQNDDPSKFKKIPNKYMRGNISNLILPAGGIASVDKCQELCSSDETCKFANYDVGLTSCDTFSGTGVLKNRQGNTALIAPVSMKQYTSNLEVLNQKLMDLNQQIVANIISITPESDYVSKQQYTQKNLLSVYNDLEVERNNIHNLNREYINTDSEYQDNSVSVLQANTMNTIWIFITAFIVMTTIKVTLFNK